MTDPPAGVERRILTRDQYRDAARGDIDPDNYAGEGFFATDEYFPQDIDNPHIRSRIEGGGEDDYYPPPKWPRNR